MTQQELDALPDDSYRFGANDVVIDGKTVRLPVLEPPHYGGPLYQPENEPMMVLDHDGTHWMLGYGPDGTRYKRRMI